MGKKYNQRVKVYPNGLTVVTTFNLPVFGSDDVEDDKSFRLPPERKKSEKIDAVVKRDDNISRAKNKIFDIAFMNKFDYFVTLTFDPKKIDCFDSARVNKVMQKWLNNCVNRFGLRYLAVPEYHKSGAIHFHLLLSGDLMFVDSGTVLVPTYSKPIKRETAVLFGIDESVFRTVYNIKNWRYGWSTAVRFNPVDDGGCGTSAIAKYLTKYITKDLVGVCKRLYYSGGDIVRDVPTFYNNAPFGDVNSLERSVGDTGLKVKYETFIS